MRFGAGIRPSLTSASRDMATITTKKPEKAAASEQLKVDQRRPAMERYRLQVDRQMKASFTTFEEAEKRGKAIKKSHPVVQVTVYDIDEHETKIVS